MDAFRPPIDQHHIDLGLSTVKKYVGHPYDWWVVIDDGLRYVSRYLIYLPVSFVQPEERKGKVCSPCQHRIEIPHKHRMNCPQNHRHDFLNFIR